MKTIDQVVSEVVTVSLYETALKFNDNRSIVVLDSKGMSWRINVSTNLDGNRVNVVTNFSSTSDMSDVMCSDNTSLEIVRSLEEGYRNALSDLGYDIAVSITGDENDYTRTSSLTLTNEVLDALKQEAKERLTVH